MEILSEELSFLFDPDTELTFDPRVIGFETVELDQILWDEPILTVPILPMRSCI